MTQPAPVDLGTLAELADEIVQLWKLGAETAVIEQRLRFFRDAAAGHYEQALAIGSGPALAAARQDPEQRRAYDEMIGRINTVLADFADGQPIQWYEMFEAIKHLLADHQIDLASGDFAIPVVTPANAGGDRLVAWGSDLEIGVDWVDRHHRGMVDMLNEIGRLPAQSDPVDRDALLEALRRSTWHHFHEEEARLPTGPDASQHIAAHRRLLAVLDRLLFDVRSHRIDLPTVARNVLRDWLIDHILTLDRRDFGGVSRGSDTD